MPWIWNDQTFSDRYKKETVVLRKILFPLFLINTFVWIIFIFHDVKIYEILLIVFASTIWIYTLINIFYQFPNSKIPDWYSKWAQTLLYIIHFLIASFLFFLIIVGILQHYYPFFEKLAFCDFIKNFPKI